MYIAIAIIDFAMHGPATSPHSLSYVHLNLYTQSVAPVYE
eukprot:COSAG06_NODE_40640_length_400_cov_0.621262_2_plen_39_part_01